MLTLDKNTDFIIIEKDTEGALLLEELQIVKRELDISLKSLIDTYPRIAELMYNLKEEGGDELD